MPLKINEVANETLYSRMFKNEVIISTSTSGDLSLLVDSPLATQKSVFSSTIKTQITNSSIPSPFKKGVQLSPVSATCDANLSCGGSNVTLDTLEEQQQYEIYTLKEFFSWDTHGSVSTSPSTSAIDTSFLTDNAGNHILFEGVKAHQTRLKGIDTLSPCEQTTKIIYTKVEYNPIEKKTKSNNRKKVVKFYYPHISSLKLCPRIMNEDKNDLFFTEDELEQYHDDRRSILHGTIEVISECGSREVGLGYKIISSTLNESHDEVEDMVIHEYGLLYDDDRVHILHHMMEIMAIHDSDSDSESEEIGFEKNAVLPTVNEGDNWMECIAIH